ncbi:threonine/serine exporter ThrE family protein [Streptomyces sp. NPDC056773]|uniref:threonine/serine ThrE exporter family protein n=1 Tax=unclassified Streptomyces TaxID=2593676 RepID=UPI00369E955D
MSDGAPDRTPWRKKRWSGRSPAVPAVTVPGVLAPDRLWTRELARMLCELGVELLRAGKRTASVESDLGEIAACYGMLARSFVVPTGLFVRVEQLDAEADGELDFALLTGGDLRLDQAQVLEDLMVRMRAEALPFAEVHAALEAMRTLPRSVGPALSVFGYVVATVGLGMMFHATVPAVIGYAVLGLVIGLLRVLTASRFPFLGPVLPVLSGALATGLAQAFAGPLLHESPQFMFIAPLVGFLPGAALSMAPIELSLGYTLSGVSRLAGALNVLLMLAVGILVGVQSVDARPAAGPPPPLMGEWVGWVGAVLFLVGFVLYFSAPVRTVPWMVAALLLARVVQTAGEALGGLALGAFLAGMMLPPMALWIQRRHRIPELLIFLPCYWVLVPGASSLEGVTQLLSRHTAASMGLLVNAVVTLVAIGLGILAGARLGSRPRVRLGSPPQPPAPAPASTPSPAAT